MRKHVRADVLEPHVNVAHGAHTLRVRVGGDDIRRGHEPAEAYQPPGGGRAEGGRGETDVGEGDAAAGREAVEALLQEGGALVEVVGAVEGEDGVVGRGGGGGVEGVRGMGGGAEDGVTVVEDYVCFGLETRRAVEGALVVQFEACNACEAGRAGGILAGELEDEGFTAAVADVEDVASRLDLRCLQKLQRECC